jgi:hypothetical protein
VAPLSSTTPPFDSAPIRKNPAVSQPGNGVAGHGFVKAHEDSISESRPPFPLFVDEIQPPPAQYGRESYTTRPPWMASDQP